MRISEVSVPAVYKESGDFRFFLRWFEYALTRIHHDTENTPDLYDPLRCPDWLLWMLADTMGFKFDDRLPVAFNRLVLVYFMSMIRNKGSKDGVTLAEEANLAQFNVIEYGRENDILYNRLEDTSIPVNAVYVTPHVAEGYIDVIYFSDKLPIDACIEYVRPVGMYIVQQPGVRFDGRTKISIDARLADTSDAGISIGPTRVGHYSRKDYASMQRVASTADWNNKIAKDPRFSTTYDASTGKTKRAQFQESRPDRELTATKYSDQGTQLDGKYIYRRELAWSRNSEAEGTPIVNAGWRALYSLQLCNNEHIVKSMIPKKASEPDGDLKDKDPIFGLGYLPQDVTTYDPTNKNNSYVLPDEYNLPKNSPLGPGVYPNAWNLRYDKNRELAEYAAGQPDVWTIEDDRTTSTIKPRPAVNPVMGVAGDAMSLNKANDQYIVNVGTVADPNLEIHNVEADGEIKNKVTNPDDVRKD